MAFTSTSTHEHPSLRYFVSPTDVNLAAVTARVASCRLWAWCVSFHRALVHMHAHTSPSQSNKQRKWAAPPIGMARHHPPWCSPLREARDKYRQFKYGCRPHKLRPTQRANLSPGPCMPISIDLGANLAGKLGNHWPFFACMHSCMHASITTNMAPQLEFGLQ